MDELDGKVAVVTGGASGIGLGLARRFGAEGMRVVVADVEEAALATAVDALRANRVDVIGVPTDVSDAAAVEALRDRALDAFGAVHVVCNNAGVVGAGRTWEVPPAVWDWVLGVNLLGVVHGVRSFVPLLVAQGEGHVVNTASNAGFVPVPMAAPYNATKAAVVAISETLRDDLAACGAAGVGVSVLCPGPVDTAIADCDRNAPEAVTAGIAAAGGVARDVEELRTGFRSMLAAGITPAAVAAAVVDAIRQDRFYVITHPDTLTSARERFDRILAACGSAREAP